MVRDLVELIERISALPISEEDRAFLVRAAIQEDASLRPNFGRINRTRQVYSALVALGGWQTAKSITAHLGIDGQYVNSALQNLLKRGAIERRPTGGVYKRTAVMEYRIKEVSPREGGTR